MESINPTTGEHIASYDPHSRDEVADALAAADRAQRAWGRRSIPERASLMRAVADQLDKRCDDLSMLMADEMGKPVTQGRAEIDKCAWVCRYYADHGGEHLEDHHVDTERRRSYVHHEPLGVVLAVMPWNFPFWQVFRFAAPALTAGNAGLLKHSANVSGCALATEELISEAGGPDGIFRTLLLGSSEIAPVIEDPRVRAVTLTGSSGAGSAVASKAGEMLKKTVLELGGSDPYVVLADADLDQAAGTCARSRLINSGQSCIAAKRFIVEDAVHDDFLERMRAAMEDAVVGDPRDPQTTVGPQAREDLRDQLHEQVEASVAAGATLLMGGSVPDRPGSFYPPTLLADVDVGMPAMDEELFGPVAAVVRAEDADRAVELANATPFGLGAAVFTADLERGEQIAARDLDAGCCFVNDLVASDPRLPFGGIKESGYGRELAHLGIREFVNQKTVVVA